MPEKVTQEEKLIALAIEKAKEVKVLQEENRDRNPVDEPLTGEEVKVEQVKPVNEKDRSKDLGVGSPAGLPINEG